MQVGVGGQQIQRIQVTYNTYKVWVTHTSHMQVTCKSQEKCSEEEEQVHCLFMGVQARTQRNTKEQKRMHAMNGLHEMNGLQRSAMQWALQWPLQFTSVILYTPAVSYFFAFFGMGNRQGRRGHTRGSDRNCTRGM